ncbi:glycosyltransferase [filamentous cyanobacterium LEGE 11480]|uniref:Glycosyltransferase n=1 Tax=Romeriopsis navalis LEGE 11480 TaxID=2777977 RepID=A0A928VNV5_9CYAN|nr:glycosyltransferase family 4 protein [Romeriopsis navalis]MBE9029414.1 glycosyltransferase [Romeriopsis navalis LEGE 11480]
MKILMLSNTFPYPPTRGGTHVRTFHLMRYLQRESHVTLATQRTAAVTDEEIAGLRDCVDELVIFDRPSTAAGSKLQRLAEFAIHGMPPSVKAGYSEAMQQWIDQAVVAEKFDVITAEHCVNEAYIRPEWRDRVRTIVNVHSSVYATCLNQLQTGTAENALRDRINLPLLKRYEQRYCQKFSQIVATTPDDQVQLQQFAPTTPIAVIPNGVDFAAFPKRTQDPGGQHLMFIGAMDNLANIDAAKFLCEEILPALQQRYPEVKISLVGARPTPEIIALGKNSAIEVTGSVESMAEYLHQATVCVIPMRTGFGIKNKTLEAMAAGVPVISGERGLEGLAIEQPQRAVRAESVPEYVGGISQLFEDANLRQAIADAAHTYVTQEFIWENAGARYAQVVLGEV